MARLRQLEKTLSKMFKSPSQKKPDTQRRQREESKRLAATHGIEIEKLRDGGMNVWPPAWLARDDPYEGDHFANDWAESLAMVKGYVALYPGAKN